ncbi:MAG: aldolase, partial [Rhodomicrobium sp.]
MRQKTVHGTCVALGNAGALLRGPCGSGKSDLALRFLYLPSDRLREEVALVADDQVILRRDGDDIVASCPKLLDGKIEVRGCGIAHLQKAAKEATLKL